ncbi:MAG: hypothetical protein KGI11_10290, partial [Thaumarchaeota archaeon]|nr:hypothetical protein [Nitrososphaerota archaeon]
GLILKGDPYYEWGLSRIRPFEPKTGEERLMLTDIRLVEESEQEGYKRLGKYVEVSNRIRKKHGIMRVIVEFFRFIKKKGLQE